MPRSMRIRVREFPFSRSSFCTAVVMVLSCFAIPIVHAQTYTVIHDFTGDQDGANPLAGLTADGAGNLYGTANYGGNFGGHCGSSGCGLVYRLTNRNSSWVLNSLYTFGGGDDGANPNKATVVLAADGTLYSTTFFGGGNCNLNGCGTVFKLQPPPTACQTALCPWTETILHSFDGTDGLGPVGALLVGAGDDIKGVTNMGNFRNGGSVYELSGPDRMLSILAHPYGYPGSGITLGPDGKLYGSTFISTDSPGAVYQLTQSGSNWIGTDIYQFTDGNDGGYPQAGVIFDQAGNLYGATTTGGSGHGGTVFELSPSNGGWSFNLLYSFTGPGNGRFAVGPVGNLVMDSAGNLYGTTIADGTHGVGAVFKLTNANGNWTYTSLHDFTGGSDGSYPYSNLTFDASGNIYGTASSGGAFGFGVVFKITP